MADMKLDRKLQRLIERRGWNQSDVARELGHISKSTVSGWFSGASRPTLEMGLRLARALGVSLEYLADDDADDPPAKDLAFEEKALLEIARDMGPDKLFDPFQGKDVEPEEFESYLMKLATRYHMTVSRMFREQDANRQKQELARLGIADFSSEPPEPKSAKRKKGAS